MESTARISLRPRSLADTVLERLRFAADACRGMVAFLSVRPGVPDAAFHDVELLSLNLLKG